MYKITLQGPKTSLTAKTDNIDLFKRFILWLRDYNYLGKKIDIGQYKLESDNRVKACKKKATQLGLDI